MNDRSSLIKQCCNRPINKFIIGGFFILLMLLKSTAVRADCVASAQNMPLGSQTSFAVYNSVLNSSGMAGLDCTGNIVLLSVLSANVLTGTLTTASSNLFLVNTGNASQQVGYTLYADAQRTKPFVSNVAVDYANNGLLGVLLSGGNINVPLYISTVPGANVSAGTYTSTVTFQWVYKLCTGLAGVGSICLGTVIQGTKTSTVAISMTVTNSCLIGTTPPVAFGSNALIEQFSAVNQSANVQCTLGASYTTYFDNGSNFSTPWRQMAGSGNFLQYNIYYPSTSTVWSSANPVSAVGTGLSQSVPYTAAINPAQAELPAAAYSDSVNFVVSY